MNMKWWQVLGLLGTFLTLAVLIAYSAVLVVQQQRTIPSAPLVKAVQKAVAAETDRERKAREQLIATCEDPEGKFTGKPLGVERSNTFAVEGPYSSILCMGHDGSSIYLLSHRSYRSDRGYWGHKYERQLNQEAP